MTTMTTLSDSEPLLPEDVELEWLLSLKLALPTESHKIHDMYESIMAHDGDGEHPFAFASQQIQHHAQEYWSKTCGQGKDDTLLMAAYRAGLYTTESTAKEIFLHAMRYIGQVGAIHSQSEHLGSRQLLADFNRDETEMAVREIDWILAADVITKEQYAEAVRMVFVERLDLDPTELNNTIIDFIGNEREYYEHKHLVTFNKLVEVYKIISSSHCSYKPSETRAVAVALAKARADVPLNEEVEDEEEDRIKETSLCPEYDGNEEEVGDNDLVKDTDLKCTEDVTEMTSCNEISMTATFDKLAERKNSRGDSDDLETLMKERDTLISEMGDGTADDAKISEGGKVFHFQGKSQCGFGTYDEVNYSQLEFEEADNLVEKKERALFNESKNEAEVKVRTKVKGRSSETSTLIADVLGSGNGGDCSGSRTDIGNYGINQGSRKKSPVSRKITGLDMDGNGMGKVKQTASSPHTLISAGGYDGESGLQQIMKVEIGSGRNDAFNELKNESSSGTVAVAVSAKTMTVSFSVKGGIQSKMKSKGDGFNQLCIADVDGCNELNEGTDGSNKGGGGSIDQGRLMFTSGGGMREKKSHTCIGSNKYEGMIEAMNGRPDEMSASSVKNVGGKVCEIEVKSEDAIAVTMKSEVKPKMHVRSDIGVNEGTRNGDGGGGGGMSDAIYGGTRLNQGGHADGLPESTRHGGAVKAVGLTCDDDTSRVGVGRVGNKMGAKAVFRPAKEYEEGVEELCLDGSSSSDHNLKLESFLGTLLREVRLSLVSLALGFFQTKARALKESLTLEVEEDSLLVLVYCAIKSIVIFVKRLIEVVSTSTAIILKNASKKKKKKKQGGCHSFVARMVASMFALCLLLIDVSTKCFVSGQGFYDDVGNGDDYEYKQYCDVFGNHGSRSCVCKHDDKPTTLSNKPTYFYCKDDSRENHCTGDVKAYKVQGYCGQCGDGKYFGGTYGATSTDGMKSCSDFDPDKAARCECSIETRDKSGEVKETHYFKFVCNHNAEYKGDKGFEAPDNQVRFISGDLKEEKEKTNNLVPGICSKCPAGTYSKQGDMFCTACPSGQYNSVAGNPCRDCEPGNYSDETGHIECRTCPAGKYSKDYGSTGCTECASGYYSSAGFSACKPADVGYYVGETIDDSLPHLHQYKCPIGSYTDLPGQSYCTPCPPNTSTYATASTSLSDCIMCPYGVDANTLACIDATSNPLDDVCWNPSQLLSLNASPAIKDLNNLVYELPDVGINDLIRDAMGVIQGAAEGTSPIEDIETVLVKLKNAPENWLDGLSQNYALCVEATSQVTYNTASGFQYHSTNLLQYQFGNYAQNRAEWIAQLQCKGATFGCTTFDTTGCRQAQTCFAPLYQFFGSILSYGGGTAFGNYQGLITGRYTPGYSPSFISQQLEDNVNSLVQWVNAATSFQRYYDVIQQIESTKSFTASAINVVLQVQSVSASVSLESSYTQGNLYYEQAQYNYNEVLDMAQIIQWGPADCPSGYNITADGIPNDCTDYETLVDQCEKEILWNLYEQRMKDTMKLATDIVSIAASGAACAGGAVDKCASLPAQALVAVGDLEKRNEDVKISPFCTGCIWDPNTQMPELPELGVDGYFENVPYADASYQWYLDGQENLSDTLIIWSPAKWDDIYRENEKQYGSTIRNPPDCPTYQSAIESALTDYLRNVERFSDYGSSMTAALMSLVPAMGNIAAGIATQAAIASANKEISGMVNQPDPNIDDTAPSEYQDVYNQLYFSTYPDSSKAIFAYSSSASLAQQQYVAAKGIFGFCASYSYMNAGRNYFDNSNGKTANCKKFGRLYLPTYGTFKDTVNWFLLGDDDAITNPPPTVDELNKRIVGFASNVQGNPSAVGQTGTQVKVGDTVQTFSLEFSNDPNSATSFYGSLADGSIRFTLTPSSTTLLNSTVPFDVFDANPRVINIQTFWRGVTSPQQYNQYMETIVNPIGPSMVYPDPSGEGTTFTLPPYKDSSSTDSAFFSDFRSIQKEEFCGTGKTQVTTSWRNDEELKFCTPYSGDLQQPFTGIANHAFLFPSMWNTWEVEADHTQWNSAAFNIDETELALQVVFRYVASSTPSPTSGGPNKCAFNCKVGTSTRDNPLIGEEWCGEKSCSDCIASHSYNGTQLTTDPFCRCNVWNGNHETCIPSTATTVTFTVEYSNSTATTASRRNRKVRRQLKKKEGKAGNSGTKAGKSKNGIMSKVPLGLEEVLQKYLEECDGKPNDLRSHAKVVIDECKADETVHGCEFHLSIPVYKDVVDSDTKKAVIDCATTMLREEEVIEAIAERVDSCDVTIYRHGSGKKRDIIAEWRDLCSLFE